jgi:hypothetical protein
VTGYFSFRREPGPDASEPLARRIMIFREDASLIMRPREGKGYSGRAVRRPRISSAISSAG